MNKYFKRVFAATLVGAAALLGGRSLAQSSSGAASEDLTVTIRADGSCQTTLKTTQSRASAVQQLRTAERLQQMQEEGDNLTDRSPKPESQTNALTDDQLKTRLIEIMQARLEDAPTGAATPEVSVDKDTVSTTRAQTFASIGELIQDGGSYLIYTPIQLENLRFELDSGGHLIATLTPRALNKREAQAMRQEFKLGGVRYSLNFVFPGAVISSGLPNTTNNATGFALDGSKDESIDTLLKLEGGPIIIKAESGGLTLKEPVDSKDARQTRYRRPEMGDDLPITEAGKGFVAEPQGVVTTVTYVFPGATNNNGQSSRFGEDSPGTEIHAKLFPPKGRTLQAVSELKVLKAVDDQGRPIAVATNAEDEDGVSAFYASIERGSAQGNSAQVQFRLELPRADAQAIDEISAQAVAVTAGDWKEMTLTNVNSSATNEIDLAEVLPGAKALISKFSSKNQNVSLQLRLTGPAAVKNLEVQLKFAGAEDQDFNSPGGEGVIKVKDGQSTRTVSLSAYSFSSNGRNSAGPCILIIRYPQDLRRERVTFSLKGLDLL